MLSLEPTLSVRAVWGGATYICSTYPYGAHILAFSRNPGSGSFHSRNAVLGSGAPCHYLTFCARLEPQLGDWDSDNNATGTACEVGSDKLITSPHASFLNHWGLPEPWYACTFVPPYAGCAPGRQDLDDQANNSMND